MEKTIFDNKPGLKKLVENFYTFGQIDQKFGDSDYFDECCAMLTRDKFAGHQFIKESFEGQILGTPEEIVADWDGGIELRPIKHIEYDGESWFEKSLEGEEVFWWSVYLHSPSKGWQCIADFWDEKSAEVFVEILKGFKKQEKPEIVTAYVAKVWFGAHPGETKDTVYANLNDIWLADITENVEEIQAVRVYEQATHRLGVDQLEDDDVFFIVGLEGRYKKVID